MELIIFWSIAAVVVAVIAANRGRSGFGWFLLAMLISPLLAGILVLALGKVQESGAAVDTPSPRTHVRCPDCRELVRRDARKCRHCGCVLVPQ